MDVWRIIFTCFVFSASLNIFGSLKQRFLLKFDFPFDFNFCFSSGKRLLGDSTTWGGLTLVILIGYLLDSYLKYSFHAVLTGLCIFFGHAAGSFIKRRLNTPRGKFIPFIDHVDHIYMVTVVFLYFRYISFLTALFCIAITLVLYPLLTFIGFKLRLRDNPL